MVEQKQLFPLPARARARRTDPETSHLAAFQVGDVTEAQRLVLLALRIGGPMTDEELIEFVRRTWPDRPMTEQSVRSRRSELVRKMLVAHRGAFGTTSNGNKARVWEAVREGGGVGGDADTGLGESGESVASDVRGQGGGEAR